MHSARSDELLCPSSKVGFDGDHASMPLLILARSQGSVSGMCPFASRTSSRRFRSLTPLFGAFLRWGVHCCAMLGKSRTDEQRAGGEQLNRWVQ